MNQPHSELINASWHNMPNKVSWEQGNLRFETCNNTDFWQDTWYGFRRDSGHFLGLQASSAFSATISFEAQYKELYDQAGIMMRVDANNWIKAGIEFSDGVINFSTVVTRDGKSDWSVVASPGLSGVQQVRLTRVKNSVLLHFFTIDQVWQLMRLTAFCTRQAKVGPMACTPERSGLSVTVSKFTIAPPDTNPLHG